MFLCTGVVLSILSFILYIVDYVACSVCVPIIPLPIIGNTLFMSSDSSTILQRLASMLHKHTQIKLYIPGKTLFGLRRWIFINDAKSMEHIMKHNFNNYPKGDVMKDVFADLLGNGIFNTDGAMWKMHRKISSTIFTISSLHHYMTDVFTKHAETTVNSLKVNDCNIDIQKEFLKYTLHGIYEIGFGQDLKYTSSSDEFMNSFNLVQNNINKRFYVPGWRLLKRLNIGYEGTINGCLRTIDQHINELIKSHKGHGKDLLSLFKSKADLSIKEQRDIITNFMLAGRDTTAVLLTWSIYVITKYPYIKNRILEEFNEVDSFEYKKITSLRYLRGFFYEVLRFYPSVPINIKSVAGNDILPNKVRLYKDDVIVFMPYALGRTREVWGEDVDEFKPERWIDTKHSAYKYMAFNAGYRTCLGQNMALLESSIMLVKLLQNFDFKLTKPVVYNPQVIFSVKDGLYVDVINKNRKKKVL